MLAAVDAGRAANARRLLRDDVERIGKFKSPQASLAPDTISARQGSAMNQRQELDGVVAGGEAAAVMRRYFHTVAVIPGLGA